MTKELMEAIEHIEELANKWEDRAGDNNINLRIQGLRQGRADGMRLAIEEIKSFLDI